MTCSARSMLCVPVRCSFPELLIVWNIICPFSTCQATRFIRHYMLEVQVQLAVSGGSACSGEHSPARPAQDCGSEISILWFRRAVEGPVRSGSLPIAGLRHRFAVHQNLLQWMVCKRDHVAGRAVRVIHSLRREVPDPGMSHLSVWDFLAKLGARYVTDRRFSSKS